MMRLPIALVALFYGVVEGFVGTPTGILAGRANAVYTKTWGSDIYAQQQARAARLGNPQRAGRASPRMDLMLLADGDLPISMEQQESIISFFSLASSALLLVIIGGAVYLSVVEFNTKKEKDKSEQFIASTGELPPDISPDKPSSRAGDDGGGDDEGNRSFRRMAKKERQKGKSP